MKKLLLIIMLVCITAFCGTGLAYAEGDIPGITDIYVMTGKLYYCDTPTGRVVLTEVSSAAQDEASKASAAEAEYLEIRVSPDCMRMNDGSVITAEYLNMYADSDVWFITARDKNGNLVIPYLQFK